MIFSIEYYTTIDYRVYYENFQFPPKGVWEPLYMLLVMIFKPFGYVFFNACMAAFEMYTLCFMIKNMWISVGIGLLLYCLSWIRIQCSIS